MANVRSAQSSPGRCYRSAANTLAEASRARGANAIPCRRLRARDRKRGEPAARCPTKAAARRLRSPSRGSACASSGLCTRPPRTARQLSAWQRTCAGSGRLVIQSTRVPGGGRRQVTARAATVPRTNGIVTAASTRTRHRWRGTIATPQRAARERPARVHEGDEALAEIRATVVLAESCLANRLVRRSLGFEMGRSHSTSRRPRRRASCAGAVLFGVHRCDRSGLDEAAEMVTAGTAIIRPRRAHSTSTPDPAR